jgi:hypothetical protein
MLQDKVNLSYVTDLDEMHKDFTNWFVGLLNLQITQWMLIPYVITTMKEANVIMQEEHLLALSQSGTDKELKQKFNQVHQF